MDGVDQHRMSSELREEGGQQAGSGRGAGEGREQARCVCLPLRAAPASTACCAHCLKPPVRPQTTPPGRTERVSSGHEDHAVVRELRDEGESGGLGAAVLGAHRHKHAGGPAAGRGRRACVWAGGCARAASRRASSAGSSAARCAAAATGGWKQQDLQPGRGKVDSNVSMPVGQGGCQLSCLGSLTCRRASLPATGRR